MKFTLMVTFLILWNDTKGKGMIGKLSFINDKAIMGNPDGSVLIIPQDGSFVRFINKSWYD